MSCFMYLLLSVYDVLLKILKWPFNTFYVETSWKVLSMNTKNWDVDGSSSGSFEIVRFGLTDAEESCYDNFIHVLCVGIMVETSLCCFEVDLARKNLARKFLLKV
jgi:hypothetical protein